MARTTNKRQEILDFLRQFSAENGYIPSVREIMQAVGLKSTASVHYHLKGLSDQGLIETVGGKNRAIRLPTSQGVPIIGTVAAGLPILAEENIEGYLPWEAEDNYFALRVKGDSMVDAHIFDGDKVVVRQQATVENGEIVVALLGDEATVKRFRKEKNQIWLLPENPNYSPIAGNEATILGVVRAVVREF